LTVLGVGLLLVVWFQVRFGLRPLQVLQQALGDIRKGNAQRLPESFPVEVEPVVSELNGLLDHNGALLERARTQVGNLAHALKNPLTVIRNEAGPMENERGRVIREQTAAMANSVDRYLSQARIAGTAGVLGARADLKVIVEDLEEMLGNLIDNACKWARSQVLVHAESADGRLRIVVEDDGPGIPEKRQVEVLERGRRLDEKIPGSGLGLDIAQDIAGLYRGSITLGRASSGGLSVQLDLPATD